MTPSTPAALLSVAVDPGLTRPGYLQLYDQVRELILSGRLGSGARLPASRVFAAELGLSRTTVVAAYDQLKSEGYIEQRRGDGSYVSHLLPEHLIAAAPAGGAEPTAAPLPRTARPQPFAHAIPDLDGFPIATWSRLLQRSWQSLDPVHLERGDPFGYPPLRRAIARHLKDWRGIVADPADIIVTASSTESLRLTLDALLPRRATVVTEDPGYRDMRQAIADSGRAVRAVPVDDEGLSVASLLDGEADAAVVTPSRQFPLGITMSLARRLALLAWAGDGHRWIVEDDFDSEYRYTGSPLDALSSLDRTGRVVYLGTFSKVLFRTLRISYLAIPPAARERFRAVLQRTPATASMVPQPALAALVESGGFATHLRRMRRLYGQRARALGVAVEQWAGDLLELQPIDSGMHAIAWLRPEFAQRMDDDELAARASAAGVAVRPLGSFYLGTPPRRGLVLGFAGFDEAALADATHRLAAALR